MKITIQEILEKFLLKKDPQKKVSKYNYDIIIVGLVLLERHLLGCCQNQILKF